jgi:hypothetical protein
MCISAAMRCVAQFLHFPAFHHRHSVALLSSAACLSTPSISCHLRQPKALQNINGLNYRKQAASFRRTIACQCIKQHTLFF